MKIVEYIGISLIIIGYILILLASIIGDIYYIVLIGLILDVIGMVVLFLEQQEAYRNIFK